MSESSADLYVFFYEWEVGPKHPLYIVCYSQWYTSNFVDPQYPRCLFRTAEHYMMYRKALLFDPEAAQAIIDAPTPDEAKKRGREVRNFDREIWKRYADDIVERANYLKFGQNEQIREFLFETEGKTMVEASPTDRIWGIGLSAEDAPGKEPEWGMNRMGLALTRARIRLIRESRQ